MEGNVIIATGDAGDAVQVSVVVSENDVNGAAEAFRQLSHDERRTQIAANDHRFGVLHSDQGVCQVPDVVVDI
jgi:hypothetical protein